MKNHNKDAQIRQKRCMDCKKNVMRNSTYNLNNEKPDSISARRAFLNYYTQGVTFADTSHP